jgi:hypothetical protein
MHMFMMSVVGAIITYDKAISQHRSARTSLHDKFRVAVRYLKTSSNQSNMIWCARLSSFTPQ